jgi:hypothetical protein
MTRAERNLFRLGYAAWLFGVIAFFVPPATWNPVSRLALTRAIVDRGTLSIDADIASTGDRSLVHGRWYTDKAPLPSLLAIPAYATVRLVQKVRGVEPAYRAFSIGTTPAARFEPNQAFQQVLYASSLSTAGASGVAIGLLLFELLRRRTAAHTAFAASAITVLGTPILPYASSFYGHVSAGAFLLGALVAFDPRGARGQHAVPEAWRLRIAGMCVAAAAGCEYLTAIPGALLTLWFLSRMPPRSLASAIGNLALGAALPAILVGGYHTAVFGAPWRTGYSFIARPEFAAGHAQGFLGVNPPRWDALVGLTFGTRRGLFYIAPIALLGFAFGLYRAVRTRDTALAGGLGAFVILLLLNAGYYMWWGGAAAGPRHVIPCIAFTGVGLVLVLRSSRLWLRRAGVAAAVLSVANAVALASVGLEAPEQGDILQDYAWPGVLDGRISVAKGATNFAMKFGSSRAISLLPLVIWIAFGFWYLGRQTRRGRVPSWRENAAEPSVRPGRV